MTSVQITVVRSAEWVAQQRLTMGENVPVSVNVDVDVADLSVESRTILLAHGCGSYPVGYNGWVNGPVVDSHAPTPAQIDAALIAAEARLAAKRAAEEARIAAKRAAEEAQKIHAAEEAQKITQARVLLSADLDRGQQCDADRRTLAAFLARVPQDALRGTLKAIAHGPEAIEELRKKVEDASPVLVLFEDEDEDEDDN